MNKKKKWTRRDRGGRRKMKKKKIRRMRSHDRSLGRHKSYNACVVNVLYKSFYFNDDGFTPYKLTRVCCLNVQ